MPRREFRMGHGHTTFIPAAFRIARFTAVRAIWTLYVLTHRFRRSDGRVRGLHRGLLRQPFSNERGFGCRRTPRHGSHRPHHDACGTHVLSLHAQGNRRHCERPVVRLFESNLVRRVARLAGSRQDYMREQIVRPRIVSL